MIMERIINILSDIKGLDGWKINEKTTESKEIFFIKKNIDMVRSKDVQHISLTVYKDFEEDGVKYRGSSLVDIHPTMGEEEIREVIEGAVYSAGFVKNKYYPLVKPSYVKTGEIENTFDKDSLSNWISRLSKEAFVSDKHEKGWINSLELFLDKNKHRIINSEGVDISYGSYRGELEFITNWQEAGEEIELYEDLLFSDYQENFIIDAVDEMLKISRDKALAIPTPQLKDIPIILTGDPVKEFFDYYYSKSSARAIYEGTSTAKIGESIQGPEVFGDRISMFLDPDLKNSILSSPFDGEGQKLSKVEIYKDGILKRYWGNKRFSHYLGIETTGFIQNIVVGGGSKGLSELKEGKYVELIAFSDFEMDPVTGDFAGEIRLGWYNDGNKTIPITGGSISGNINEVHGDMYLSKEIQNRNNFMGPKSMKIRNVDIVSG